MHPIPTRSLAEKNLCGNRMTAAASISKTPTSVPYSGDTQKPTWESLAASCQYRLTELAQHCQVSMRTLQRHFRKHYNTTLSDWVRELRLERARLMLESAESVKYVAFELGYKQPSHFTRDFKQRYGVPPSAFRWPARMPAVVVEDARRF